VTVYHLRGKVVSTDPSQGIVVLDHEAIPGFMGAMTMPYQLKNVNVASALHPGDTITADVLVSKKSENTVLLVNIDIIGQAKPDYKPAVNYHVPAPGNEVPDFALRNQDGRTIHLRQFRGKALLITFIYTRCPFPNFCPLVSRNFATINKALAANAKLNGKTQLLSVSLDPSYDTPARLKAYGAGYIGGHMTLGLLDQGEKVVVLDNLSTGFAWAVPEGAKLVVGDTGDKGLVARLIREHGIDAIAQPQNGAYQAKSTAG